MIRGILCFVALIFVIVCAYVIPSYVHTSLSKVESRHEAIKRI